MVGQGWGGGEGGAAGAERGWIDGSKYVASGWLGGRGSRIVGWLAPPPPPPARPPLARPPSPLAPPPALPRASTSTCGAVYETAARATRERWPPESADEGSSCISEVTPHECRCERSATLFKDAREAGLEAPTAGAEAVEPDDTAEGAAEWATAEPEEDDEYMQYVDWDRFEAEQGEAVEQGGGEQGGEE